MKNTVTEINNTLEGINSRLDKAEVHISNLDSKVVENTQLKQKNKK